MSVVAERAFRPTGRGGGARPGKAQAGRWPWVIKVVADAVVSRAKGGAESWLTDRSAHLRLEEFGRQMDRLLPGWREKAAELMPGRKTDAVRLLFNRVYKMHYSGTSDRGRRHDPLTRASESDEHWTKHIPVTHPLRSVHAAVASGQLTVIPEWRQYLSEYEQQERLF